MKLHEKDLERYNKEKQALGETTITSSGRSRSNKSKDRIKSATTAFVFFCRELRPKIKADNPDFPPDQIRRMLSEVYNLNKLHSN